MITLTDPRKDKNYKFDMLFIYFLKTLVKNYIFGETVHVDQLFSVLFLGLL